MKENIKQTFENEQTYDCSPLGSKYVSEVLLDLKGQGFLSWKEKSQKVENVKGIANPWWWYTNQRVTSYDLIS